MLNYSEQDQLDFWGDEDFLIEMKNSEYQADKRNCFLLGIAAGMFLLAGIFLTVGWLGYY
jgi:hypothetical protein